jgi:hypothetical protein
MRKLMGLLVSLSVLLLPGSTFGESPTAKIKYRSFCYDDWLCEFMVNPSPVEPKYLDMLVGEAAEGGADVLVINPTCSVFPLPSCATG